MELLFSGNWEIDQLNKIFKELRNPEKEFGQTLLNYTF